MKHLLIFIVFLIIGLFCLQDLHMFSQTKDGARFEYFKNVTTKTTPLILSNYLNRVSVHYSIYKIPNYVHEYMVYDKRFSYVYNSGGKFTILIFKPQQYVSTNNSAYDFFYQTLKNLVNTEYKDSFNIIVQEDFQENLLSQKVNSVAYRDLKEYCGSFCLIDPVQDTMFVFKKISNTEAEALEVLLQQYYFMRR